MFIDYVGQNRATRTYAEGHLEYLSVEVRRLSRELHQARADPGSDEKLRECQYQMDALADQLSRVGSSLDNAETLRAASKRVRTIRRALEQANASL
jgi:hypothetical protein